MAYENTDALQNEIKDLQTPYGHGLIQLLRDHVANNKLQQLDQINKANDANRQQELASLLKGYQTGRVGDTYASAPIDSYIPTDPTLQGLVAKLKAEQVSNQKQNPLIQEYEYGQQNPGAIPFFNKKGKGSDVGKQQSIFQDAQGNYHIGVLQDGDSGPSATVVQNPAGMKLVPDAGRLGYDSEAINNKRDAERFAKLKDIFATQGPEAAAAAMKELAVGQAQNTTLANSAPIKNQIEAGNTAAQKGGEDLQTYREMARNAGNTLDAADQLKQELDSGIYNSGGAQFKTAVANFLNGMGVLSDDQKQKLINTQAFNKSAMQIPVSQLKSMFGARPGVAEFQAWMQANPNQTLDPQAIRQLLDTSIIPLAASQIRDYQSANEFATQNKGSLNGWLPERAKRVAKKDQAAPSIGVPEDAIDAELRRRGLVK